MEERTQMGIAGRIHRMTTVSDRIGERLQAKMNDRVGARPDLYLGDYRMAGANLATVAIGYNHADYGTPTTSELSEFVIKASLGRLRPHEATRRDNSGRNTITLNVVHQRPFSPFSEMQSQLAPLGGKRYLHAQTNDVWELEDQGGSPIVYRVAEENLSEVLSQMTGQLIHPSTTRVAYTDNEGTPYPSAGTQVKFFGIDGHARLATVMSEPDREGNMHITGEQCPPRIHVNSVTEVFRTAELDGVVQDKLEKYFAEMFGDAQYAKDLVRQASPQPQVGTGEQLVAFLTDGGLYDVNAATIALDNMKRTPGQVHRLGPQNASSMVLAAYNGNGFEWEVDTDEAVKALQGGKQTNNPFVQQ